MLSRELQEGIHWAGAMDWDRHTLDEHIPLPAGTSCNACLVKGREKTALIGTVDQGFTGVLPDRLADAIAANHSEPRTA
jgi:flavorubredoxin